jgi:hypothetical protein
MTPYSKARYGEQSGRCIFLFELKAKGQGRSVGGADWRRETFELNYLVGEAFACISPNFIDEGKGLAYNTSLFGGDDRELHDDEPLGRGIFGAFNGVACRDLVLTGLERSSDVEGFDLPIHHRGWHLRIMALMALLLATGEDRIGCVRARTDEEKYEACVQMVAYHEKTVDAGTFQGE